MNDRELIDRLRTAEWPAPSPDLRARVAATSLKAPAIAWSDRVWYSRGWRVGVAAATIALVALDYWGARSTGPIAASIVREDAQVQGLEDLVRSAGLPDDAASLVRRTLMTRRSSVIDRDSLISDISEGNR